MTNKAKLTRRQERLLRAVTYCNSELVKRGTEDEKAARALAKNGLVAILGSVDHQYVRVVLPEEREGVFVYGEES